MGAWVLCKHRRCQQASGAEVYSTPRNKSKQEKVNHRLPVCSRRVEMALGRLCQYSRTLVRKIKPPLLVGAIYYVYQFFLYCKGVIPYFFLNRCEKWERESKPNELAIDKMERSVCFN